MTKRPDTSPQASADLIRQITQAVVRHDIERSRAAAERILPTASAKTQGCKPGGCECNKHIPRDNLGEYFRVYRVLDPSSMSDVRARQLRWLRSQYAPWEVSPHLFEDLTGGQGVC